MSSRSSYVIGIYKAGPYIGPRGGKWADPQHKIPWKESGLRLYHGAHTKFCPHKGLCLTDDHGSARVYASTRGEVAAGSLDLTGLKVHAVTGGYDRDSDTAPGDRHTAEQYPGADVITYEDEDERGRRHKTWRLLSDRAVSRYRSQRAIPVDWWDAAEDAGVDVDDRLAWYQYWEPIDDPEEAAYAHEHGQTIEEYAEENDIELTKARIRIGFPVGLPPSPNREEHPYEATMQFQGILIYVENRKGTTRSGTGPDGKKWSVRMKHDYGEIPGTRGADGDPIDVYVGPVPHAEFAFILHQKHSRPTEEQVPGVYDEDKVMLGFATEEAALRAHAAHFDHAVPTPGVTVMPVSELREKLYSVEADLGAALVKNGDMIAYKRARDAGFNHKHADRIAGGRADKMDPEDFDLAQLKMGMEHEREHTSDDDLALEIAMDHLAEDPKYYTKLKTIEKSEKPPGGGWSAIPGGKSGGFRRPKHGGSKKWEYWYPGQKAISTHKRWEEDPTRTHLDLKPGDLVTIGGKPGYWHYTPEHAHEGGEPAEGRGWFTSTSTGEHLQTRMETAYPIRKATPRKPVKRQRAQKPKAGHVRIGDWEGPAGGGGPPPKPQQGEEAGGRKLSKPFKSEHPEGTVLHGLETGDWGEPHGRVMLHQIKTGDDRMRWAVFIPESKKAGLLKEAEPAIRSTIRKVMRKAGIAYSKGSEYDDVKAGALLGFAMALTRYQGGKPFMAVAHRYMQMYAMREARHLKGAATITDRTMRNMSSYAAAKLQAGEKATPEEIAAKWRIKKKHAYASKLGSYAEGSGKDMVLVDQGNEDLPNEPWRVRGPDGREHGPERPGKLALMDAYEQVMSGQDTQIDFEGQAQLDVLPNQAELAMPLGTAFHMRLEMEGGLDRLSSEERTALTMHAGMHSEGEGFPASLIEIADELGIDGSAPTKRRKVNDILERAKRKAAIALEGTEVKRHLKRLWGHTPRQGPDDPKAFEPYAPSHTKLRERFGNDRAVEIYHAALRAGHGERTAKLLDKAKAGKLSGAERERMESEFAAQVSKDRLAAFRRYRAQAVDPRDTKDWGSQPRSPYASVETDYLLTRIKRG